MIPSISRLLPASPNLPLLPLVLALGLAAPAAARAQTWVPVGPHGGDVRSLAADRPWHEAASLGVQKAGLRNLVRSVDATLRDDGVRYGELLSAAGVPVEVHNAETLVHGYLGYAGVVPAATDAVERGLSALRRALT